MRYLQKIYKAIAGIMSIWKRCHPSSDDIAGRVAVTERLPFTRKREIMDWLPLLTQFDKLTVSCVQGVTCRVMMTAHA